MSKTLYTFVNGILTFPGEHSNWNARAVTWIQSRTEAKAEKIEYFCNCFTRKFHNKQRAYKLYRTLSFYKRWNHIVIGHSNGVDVILDMLNNYVDWPKISHLHLVCGAGEADFNKNGLNRLLDSNRIGYVTCYVAGNDLALKLAHTITGKIIGYGTLGLHGPFNVKNSLEHRVNVVWNRGWENYTHSECWSDDNFDKTMKLFI